MNFADGKETAPAVGLEIGNACTQCGSRRLRRDLVKSAFWHDDSLVVVEEIPAVVCEDCGERFFDDATATILDLMHGDGFPPAQACGHLHVPVFSFSARVPTDLTAVAEGQG